MPTCWSPILDADAGAFCVPSKVLSYMCAGRAVLGAMPRQNLAARVVVDQNAGRVVEPDDVAGFRAAAIELARFAAAAGGLRCGGAALCRSRLRHRADRRPHGEAAWRTERRGLSKS